MLYLYSAYIMWSVQAVVLCQLFITTLLWGEQSRIILPVWCVRKLQKPWAGRARHVKWQMLGIAGPVLCCLYISDLDKGHWDSAANLRWGELRGPRQTASLVRCFLLRVSQNSSPLLFPAKAVVLPSASDLWQDSPLTQPSAFSKGTMMPGHSNSLGVQPLSQDQ